MKPLLVWVSDLHINSKVALRYPEAIFDDGDTSICSPSQKALWEAWLDFWKYVERKKGKRKLFVAFGGEIVDMDIMSRSNQYHSRNKTEVLSLAADTISPAIDLADKVIVIRGTQAHVGKQGELDEAAALDIDNIVPDTQTASHYHYRCKIGNFVFDMGHHCSMGTRPWTKANAGNLLAKLTLDQYRDWGETPPDFVLRGHVHRKADSGENFAPLHALISGCWTFPDMFTHRIGASNERPCIGGWIIDTETGAYEWRAYVPDRAAPERIG